MASVPFEQEYEVYAYGESLCSQMVRIACEEKEIDWLSKPVMLAEVAVDSTNFTPHYLTVNPKARVPTLVHNGTPIYESYEIIKYLDRQNPDIGQRLYPDDNQVQKRIDAWVVESSLRDDGRFGASLGMAIPMVSAPAIRWCLNQQPFWHVMTKFSRHPVLSRRVGFRAMRFMPVPKGVRYKSIRSIARALLKIESELAVGNEYILSDFTQVDVMMMAHFHRLEDVGLGKVLADGTLPGIAVYWNRLQARPSYEAAVLNYHDSHWREALRAVFGSGQSTELEKLIHEINKMGADTVAG